jgi:hypothetical protein
MEAAVQTLAQTGQQQQKTVRGELDAATMKKTDDSEKKTAN